MKHQKMYLILFTLLILIGAFCIYKKPRLNNNIATRSQQVDIFGTNRDKRMLKCWVREQVPKGYDSYGHEMQPASIELKDISIKHDKNEWVIYSKLFAGKNSQTRTYHIKQNSSGMFTLYHSNNHKVASISETDLKQRYKDQTI